MYSLRLPRLKRKVSSKRSDGYDYQNFYLRYQDLQNMQSQLTSAADALYSDVDEVLSSLPEDDPAYEQFDTLAQNIAAYTS